MLYLRLFPQLEPAIRHGIELSTHFPLDVDWFCLVNVMRLHRFLLGIAVIIATNACFRQWPTEQEGAKLDN